MKSMKALKGRRDGGATSRATRPGSVRPGRDGSRRDAETQREITPKSVAIAVGPSRLDAPIEIGIGIGIEPGGF